MKLVLIDLLGKQGMIHKKIVPEGERVKNKFYVQVLERILKRISRVMTLFRQEGSWFLSQRFS
jgi:hypothetical protein